MDGVLGSRARVSVLRVLHAGHPELNAREVARRAGLAHRSAQLALTALAHIGAARMRAIGNNHVFSLNPAFHLNSPSLSALFEAERSAPEVLALDLVRHHGSLVRQHRPRRTNGRERHGRFDRPKGLPRGGWGPPDA